ncbi:MAG: hypothetical protein ACREHD_25780 [Pirellulales bacterium]
MSATAIAELKAAQQARAAKIAEAAPNGNGGGVADDLIDAPNSPNGLQNMMPSLGRLLPPVTAKDVVISYAHGQPGKNADVDNIASVLQDVTVAETSRLRDMAELAATRGNQTLQQVIPGFDQLPTWAKKYLSRRADNPAYFGNALHQMVEKSLTDSGLDRTLRLQIRQPLAGGAPDYQFTFPNGEIAVFDLTTPKEAGKIVRKYLQDATLFLVEILHPGP